MRFAKLSRISWFLEIFCKRTRTPCIVWSRFARPQWIRFDLHLKLIQRELMLPPIPNWKLRLLPPLQMEELLNLTNLLVILMIPIASIGNILLRLVALVLFLLLFVALNNRKKKLNMARCLKIPEKVSFNIASEASYVTFWVDKS